MILLWGGLAILALLIELIFCSYAFLWIGLSAGLVSLTCAVFSLAPQWALLLFLLNCAIGGGFFLLRPKTDQPVELPSPFQRLIGRSWVLTHPLSAGVAQQAALADGFWLVRAEVDLAEGSRVKVYGHDGVVLLIAL